MEKLRISAGLENKKEAVSLLVNKINESKTVLVASVKSLPSSQFQKIKKKLKGKAEIRIAKKSLVLRAIAGSGKGAMQNLKDFIGADVAIFFSDLDAFELSALLTENQSPSKAKAGDIAPHDIRVEAGPTDLIPGPAISELGSVGLKVAVEGGKLSIKDGTVVAKEGQEINNKVAGVLSKLNIFPMKVGFLAIAAYDSVSDKVYSDIKIDREAALLELRSTIGKALGFAVNVGYPCDKTIKFFIIRAGIEEKAIEKIIDRNNQSKKEEAS